MQAFTPRLANIASNASCARSGLTSFQEHRALCLSRTAGFQSGSRASIRIAPRALSAHNSKFAT
jgi:hypothetical protein